MLVLLAVPDFDSENLDYNKYSLSVRKRGAVLIVNDIHKDASHHGNIDQ